MATDDPQMVPPQRVAPQPAKDLSFRAVVPPYRFGELLVAIAERGLTGKLLLNADVGERTLYFFRGWPVFAQSSQFNDRLGAVGVRNGLFTRDDVANALALARSQHCELGKALLELGCVDGCTLFRLLGAQLMEQVGSCCGRFDARARFVADEYAVDHVAMLRLHPLTAVLAAVRAMPSAERAAMLSAVNHRRIVERPLPDVALTWLEELGIMGDPRTLMAANLTMSAVTSRLIARMKSTTIAEFALERAPFATRDGGSIPPRVDTKHVAELIALTLLLSNAFTVNVANNDRTSNPASNAAPPESVPPPWSNELGTGFEALLPVSQPHTTPQEGAAVIEKYFTEPRAQPLASRAAIWGPAAELGTDAALSPLLTLYLTLKPEQNPHSVLDVVKGDSTETVGSAYARYSEFLTTFDGLAPHALVAGKRGELQQCFDRAFAQLVPETVGVAHASNTGETSLTNASVDAAVRATHQLPSEAAPAQSTDDALAASTHVYLRAQNWKSLAALLAPVASERTLPAALALALGIAQREHAATTQARRYKRVVFLCFVIGVGGGWFLRQYAEQLGLF